jgi:histidinol-phosphatase
VNPEWRSRYELAIEVAKEAARLAMRYYDNDVAVEWKQDHSPVTIADREAEALLREKLLKAFPHDGFLGEESGDAPGSSGFRWIIDPVDGTRSFVRGIPLWATLVGLEYKGEQIAGVAEVPALGHGYRALRGDGAYRNDRRLRVSEVADLGEAQLFYSSISWFVKAGKREEFLSLAAGVQRQRGYGDFYGFILVAQGSGELMVEHGTHAWDLAAPKVIVEEAGGRFTDWSGGSDIFRPDVLASNGKLHDVALDILGGKSLGYNGRVDGRGPSISGSSSSGEKGMHEVVIQGPSGPKIAGTRVTIHQVFDLMQGGMHPADIVGALGLSSRQVREVMKYCEAHKDEVLAVHRQIEERIARGHPPEVQAKLDAIRAKCQILWADKLRDQPAEEDDEGNSP